MPAHNAPGEHAGLTGDRTSGPDELQLDPVITTHRLPKWVPPVVGVILTVAAVAGGGYGAYRYNASKPDVVITASAPRTPWKLVPPLSMEQYSRDANEDVTPTSNPTSKKQATSATYSKGGVATAVLVLSRPETDAKKFMTEDAGMNTIIAEGDGFCGTNIDSNRDACVVIRDNTAIMVVDLVGASRADLMKLTVKFADTLAV